MPITVVRYQAKEDRAGENQALVEDVFEELRHGQPAVLVGTYSPQRRA